MHKFMPLHMKSFSKYFFKKMSQSIIKNYDKQLQSNMKTVSESERQYINNHYEMIKDGGHMMYLTLWDEIIHEAIHAKSPIL